MWFGYRVLAALLVALLVGSCISFTDTTHLGQSSLLSNSASHYTTHAFKLKERKLKASSSTKVINSTIKLNPQRTLITPVKATTTKTENSAGNYLDCYLSCYAIRDVWFEPNRNCSELFLKDLQELECVHACATAFPSGYYKFTTSAKANIVGVVTPKGCSTESSFSCSMLQVCRSEYPGSYRFRKRDKLMYFSECGASTCQDLISGDIFRELASYSSLNCLAGDMKIDVFDTGLKFVEDLQVGDMVHVGEGKYEPILWQTQHRNSEGVRGNQLVQATFVEIEFENGNKVSLTPNHFTISASGEVLAGSVKVGDVLDSQVVVDITRKFKKGAYNPQTISQKIEVNGVVVSTRTEHSPPRLVMTLALTLLSVMQMILPSAVYQIGVSTLSEFVLEPALFDTNPGLFSLINSMVFVCMVIGASEVGKKFKFLLLEATHK